MAAENSTVVLREGIANANHGHAVNGADPDKVVDDITKQDNGDDSQWKICILEDTTHLYFFGSRKILYWKLVCQVELVKSYKIFLHNLKLQ